MSQTRDWILEWAGERRITDVRRALSLTGVTPDGAAWVRFASALALWLGAVLLAASVVFFLAYNWDELGRFGKFALVDGLWLAAVVMAVAIGIERAAGKAALLAAALLTGALLALIGQTYQTGADPYELFGVWAALILPWVFAARFAPLWMLTLVLVNLAVTLYFQAFGGMLDIFFGTKAQLWTLAGINTVALIVWEWCARSGVAWMRERWPARVLLTASGVCMVMVALHATFEFRKAGPLGFAGYAAWAAAVYFYYRHRMKDLFALAGGVLATIVVVAAFLSRHLLERNEGGAFLFIGLVVIGLSAAGAWWLKQIAAEDA
jgi:uncharacterized membrane protein